MALKIIFFLFLVFLLSLFGFYSEGGQGIIRVNYPPDLTVKASGPLSISLSLPQGAADLIEIRVNNKKRVGAAPRGEFNDFSMPLELGINQIDITAKKEERVVDEVGLGVFLRSELVSKYGRPPTGFQKDHFHMRNYSQCAACHRLSPAEADKKEISVDTFAAEITGENKALAATESTCHPCHKALNSYPAVHGVSSLWSCLSCHDPHAEPTYAVPSRNDEMCFSCHVKERDVWRAKKYLHAPLNTAKCIICHDPHASANAFNLVRPIWILCLTCHVEKGSGRHVVLRYFGRGKHPTHGVPDPSRKGRELSCTSCHDAHASDSPIFSTLSPGTDFAPCKKCHIDQIRTPFPVGLF